jgi:hypothetical protein
MGRGIFSSQLTAFEAIGAAVAERNDPARREGYNKSYEYSDAIKSAFGIFAFQYPSMLQFQDARLDEHKYNNIKRVLRVEEVPSNNGITGLLDNIEPKDFSGLFLQNLQMADKFGVLEQFRVLDGGVLLAADGVTYYSSTEVHCSHCLHKTSRDETTTYYHSAVMTGLAKPNDNVFLSCMPEFIRNEDKDGEEDKEKKQDCERNAFKRWLSNYAKDYAWLAPTILGDDLYSDRNTCEAVLACGFSFIFTCKAESHKWLFTEVLPNSKMEELEVIDKKKGIISRYKWLNGAELRYDEKNPFLVNFFSLEQTKTKGKAGKAGKSTYKSWVTNKAINAENVAYLTDCARARWKIENEHNNVLKNRGYNLEHSCGHGKKYAGDVYCILNLLAFLMHTISWIADVEYQRARIHRFSRIDAFFQALRFFFIYFDFDSWDALLQMVDTGPPRH